MISPTLPNFLIFNFWDKSRNIFNFLSVLLSALVEKVGVSHMRVFYLENNIHNIKIYFTKRKHTVNQQDLLSNNNIYCWRET